MYLDDFKKDNCCGCTACKNICPVNAISMVKDEEGFLYPQIDESKCINCNACRNICPNIKKSSDNSIIESYGVKYKDTEQRRVSRSGGVFISLSNYILNNNGIVYGAMLNEDLSVTHGRAETKEERDRFKGSKYVQSDMGDTLKQVIEDLENGRPVLFSGTSCQVAAVREFIPEHLSEQLYLCDLICHGVPSKKVFDDYVKYIEETNHKKVIKVDFRDKAFGWETHFETFYFDDGTKLSTECFKKLFYGHSILRPSCYLCNFANTHRPGDITIADFWGINEINEEFNDHIGVSLTIINSEKGKAWFNNAKEELEYFVCTLEDYIKRNYTLEYPTPASPQREEFWEDYKSKDFKYILEKYVK